MNVTDPTHPAGLGLTESAPAREPGGPPQLLPLEGHRNTARPVDALAEILSRPLPAGMPVRPRDLAGRLRRDDRLARRVWSDPTFVALIDWAASNHPRAREAWDEMAVYALSRGRAYQAGWVTSDEVLTGMLNTARWVSQRGRQGERLDRRNQFVLLEDFDTAEPEMADSTFDDALAGRHHTLDPPTYLSTALHRVLPDTTSTVISETWRIARDHYEWLIKVSGLTGKALVAEAQARASVNLSRRLANRLPLDWPTATRKAAALIFTGSPSYGEGLLVWWATTPPQSVPGEVRVRWSGLLAVVNPEVGSLTETARRRARDRARGWTPTIQAAPQSIAL